MPTSPSRSDHWKLRTRTLSFGTLPKLMGIVNVTPDSFSDGGRYLEPKAAIDHALALEAQGADILDLGPQSTRPGAPQVDAEEELRRIGPVVGPVCEQAKVPVSIDTFYHKVASEAIAAGAEIVNDVTGLSRDPRMVELVASEQVGVCVMHTQGTPQTMQKDPHYTDVIAEILAYLAGRRDSLVEAGIEADRIALDPGIGFGKTLDHNLTLFKHMDEFHALGCPVLVGHSRKAFIGHVLGDMEADRTPGTVGVALAMALKGIQILRIHDVAAVKQALTLFEAAM